MTTDIIKQLDALAGAHVLVVGDVMLDRFVTGRVERISPEGPIPVLRVEREADMLGGAGNVLRNLTALGARGDLITVVGDDPAGRAVAELVAQDGAGDSRLLVAPGRATTIKERYIAGGQQLLRADREAQGGLAEPVISELVAAVRAALPRAGALVLSDYGKGVLGPEVLAALIEAAGAAACPVVVDPKGRDFMPYRGASLITPNRQELEAAAGRATQSDEEIVEACRTVIERCGVGAVLATRSERGMTLVRRDGEARQFEAEAREVFDVSGAGDTVVAVVSAALAAAVSAADAARLANAAAGIVVGKVGTAVASMGELRRHFSASALAAAESKVVDARGLGACVARWRRAGLTVGFTNGCFDLLHPGHISLLRQARAACDRLIVGLNSDSSVRRLKGDKRPVQGEAARGAVLASLADVDLVVVFAEDTPLALIEAVRPDVLIKGAEYALPEVVGADAVAGYGGRVVLADILPGHSTSRTIERL